MGTRTGRRRGSTNCGGVLVTIMQRYKAGPGSHGPSPAATSRAGNKPSRSFTVPGSLLIGQLNISRCFQQGEGPITGILRHRETSRRFVDGSGRQPRAHGVMISSYRHNQQHLSSIWRLGLKNNHSHRILFSHKAIIMMVTKQGGRCAVVL